MLLLAATEIKLPLLVWYYLPMIRQRVVYNKLSNIIFDSLMYSINIHIPVWMLLVKVGQNDLP